MKRFLASIAFAVVLFTSFSPRLAAQAVYGSIVGTVTDASSSAVPAAKVTITDLERQVVNNVEANESGNYLQRSLIVGRYRIRVEAPGFKAFQQDNVNVSADAEIRVDAKLEVGDVTQTVEVTGEAGILKTERSDVSTTYAATTIATMPLVGRRFTQLQLYAPGNAAPSNGLGTSGEVAGNQPFNTSQNGQRSTGTGYMLDGTDHHDAILSILVFQPTLDSLSETKVTTNAYDAEIGNAAAGVVSAQTKSGTNTMHGSLFEYLRNSNQQARNPFVQSRTIRNSNRLIPVNQWNQFGGSLGGAIIKNKLFFFGDYQGTRRRVGGSTQARVPTAAERTGDLSGLGSTRPIFDPRTGTGTLATRLPYANQQITPGHLSPQAQNLLKLIPLPTDTTVLLDGLNYVGSGAAKENQDQFNVRGDHFATEKLHIFGRYSVANFSLLAPGIFGIAGGRSFDPAGGIDGAGSNQAVNKHISIAGGADYVVSPTLFTDFRFGWFRYHIIQTPPTAGTNGARAAGIIGLNNDEASNDMPSFRIQDYGGGSNPFKFGNGLFTGCNCPLNQNEKQIQFVNNWTKVSGNHTIKFGADIRRAYNIRVASDRHRSGEMTFIAAGTANNAGGGSGLATFLLGNVSTMQRYVGGSFDDNLRERQNRWFFFGQDSWKVSRKLTLNYGMRWDIYKPQTVNGVGKGGNIDLATGEVHTYGVGNRSLSGNVRNDYKLFAPRLGFAYQFDPKTVIRAGYGRGFSMGAFGSIFGHNVTQNLPVLAAQNLIGANNFDAAFTFAGGPGAVLVPSTVLNGQPLGPNGLPILPDKQIMFGVRDKIRLPVVDSWNFTVQRQLTGTSSFEAGYVANIGTRQYTGGSDYDPNQPTIVGKAQGLSTNQRRPYFSIPCAGCPGGIRGWSQNFRYFGSDATARYQSLQVKYDKRFSHGLQISTHFTWSKAFDFAQAYYPNDSDVAQGLQDGNRPKALFLSANYELPFGKGKKFGSNWSRPLDLIAGGWQTNYIWQWYSGLPFTPSYQNCTSDQDVAPLYGGVCRPNRVGDSKLTGKQTRAAWFVTSPNTLANGQTGGPWQRPQNGQLGNAGRNWFLFGPQFQQLDMSFFKTFALTEKYRMQFRAEAFNFANKVNLANPNSCVDCPGVKGVVQSASGAYSPKLWQFALRLDF